MEAFSAIVRSRQLTGLPFCRGLWQQVPFPGEPPTIANRSGIRPPAVVGVKDRLG